MQKLTKLVVGLAMLTLLTGCTIKGSDPSGSGSNSGSDQNQNGANYNDGGAGGNDGSSSGDQGGDTSLPTVSNSLTVEELAEIYDWKNGEPYSEFNLDSKIVISSSGDPVGKNPLNTGKYYDSDSTYRIYGNENAKLVFQAPIGQYIRGIKLSFTGGTFKEGLQTGVMKDFNANKVTLNVTYVKSGALKISSFEVEYTGEKGTIPTPRTTWSDEELALFETYAYGIDVPYYRLNGNELKLYQEDEESEPFLSLYGAEITIEEMEPYAQLFRASTIWEELSDPLDENDLYFEAKKVTDDGERFIRAHMYVCDYFGYMVEDDDEEGYFNLDFEDPYYYEWPTELVAYIAELVGSESAIPALAGASRIELAQSDDNQYLIASYNNTQTQFNAYIELLGSTYAITDGTGDLLGTKIAIPNAKDDIELWLAFDADEGAIYIYVNKHLPHLSTFPQTEVKSRNGGNDIPVPEGATYFTYEEEFETQYDYDTDDYVEEFSQAVVTAYGIDGTELETYLTTGFNLGNWEVTLIGVDDETSPSLKAYIAQLFKNDETYYEFVMVYDIENEALEMTIYPLEGYKFSTSYPEEAINKFLTDNSLGTIPSLALSGITHYIYVENENYVWVFAQGDFEEAWLDILDSAGYIIPEAQTDYGYECRDANNTVEIDVLYDENYGQTGFTIYSTEYIDSADDWGDIDWDSLFGD